MLATTLNMHLLTPEPPLQAPAELVFNILADGFINAKVF